MIQTLFPTNFIQQNQGSSLEIGLIAATGIAILYTRLSLTASFLEEDAANTIQLTHQRWLRS